MPKRSAKHMSEQREMILEAALGCIAERGVLGTAIEDIRKAADVSAGTIYRYFANKEDLVVATLEHFSSYETVAPVPGDYSEYRAGLAKAKRPTRLSSTMLDNAMLHLMAAALSNDYLRAAILPVIERNISEQRSMIESLAKAGEIELLGTTDQTVRAVAAVGFGMSWLATLSGQPVDAATAEASAIIDHLLKPKQSGQGVQGLPDRKRKQRKR